MVPNVFSTFLRTNTGKQISYQATDPWHEILHYLGEVSIFCFAKEVKELLLEKYSTQHHYSLFPESASFPCCSLSYQNIPIWL